MRTICNTILLIAILCPTTTALCAEPSSSSAELTPEQRSEAARPLAAFRRYRTVPARRVEAIKTLAAIAPGAVELARQSLEKDFERLGGLIENRPSDPAVEEKIVELRQTLAALRADPALSKETLKTTGLAALDQLTLLYQQRQARMRTYARKLAAVTAELEQLTAFSNELEAAYTDATSVPLPTAKYRQTIAAMAGALAATDEEKLRRAEAENVRRTQGLDSAAVAGMRALNEMRVMCGLEPLLVDPKLCAAATGHSRDMQTKGFFAHESPLSLRPVLHYIQL